MLKKYVLILICILGLAIVWWRLWLYHGFVAPIHFLHWLIATDGEAAYDLALIEMLVHLAFIYMVISFFVWLYKNKTSIA